MKIFCRLCGRNLQFSSVVTCNVDMLIRINWKIHLSRLVVLKSQSKNKTPNIELSGKIYASFQMYASRYAKECWTSGLQNLVARSWACTYRAPKTSIGYTKKRAQTISDACFTKILWFIVKNYFIYWSLKIFLTNVYCKLRIKNMSYILIDQKKSARLCFK